MDSKNWLTNISVKFYNLAFLVQNSGALNQGLRWSQLLLDIYYWGPNVAFEIRTSKVMWRGNQLTNFQHDILGIRGGVEGVVLWKVYVSEFLEPMTVSKTRSSLRYYWQRSFRWLKTCFTCKKLDGKIKTKVVNLISMKSQKTWMSTEFYFF